MKKKNQHLFDILSKIYLILEYFPYISCYC